MKNERLEELKKVIEAIERKNPKWEFDFMFCSGFTHGKPKISYHSPDGLNIELQYSCGLDDPSCYSVSIGQGEGKDRAGIFFKQYFTHDLKEWEYLDKYYTAIVEPVWEKIQMEERARLQQARDKFFDR